MKESNDSFKKAIKEERFKDAEKAKKDLMSCKQEINDVQGPLINAANNSLNVNKQRMNDLKTVFKNAAAMIIKNKE